MTVVVSPEESVLVGGEFECVKAGAGEVWVEEADLEVGGHRDVEAFAE